MGTPINRSLNRRIKQVLYRMKKDYGAGPLFIYRVGTSTVDLETGVRTIDKTVYKVRKVIVLPARINRDLVQTISMISANKSFVYGGYHDSRTRLFIIERDDVPQVTEIKQDDWFVFNGRKYELKSIQEFEYDTAWVVTGKELVGDIPQQIHEVKVDHLVNISDTGEGVTNG